MTTETGSSTGRDAIDVVGEVSEERANRFYDRLRENLQARAAKLGKLGEYLLLVPDVFILLWRLANDPRVASRHKILLGSGVAYFFFPLDVIPDFLAVGFLDDLVFGVFILNRLFSDIDESIIREHWSGEGDVLDMIHKVLGSADKLVSTKFSSFLKKRFD